MTRRASPRASASGELHTHLAAPRRPAAQLPRPPAVGAGARHRADRDRRRVAIDRDDSRARRRRLPGRGVPEKEGTITHPDGRLQRLRLAVGRPRAEAAARVRRPAAVAGDRRGRPRARPRFRRCPQRRAGLDPALRGGPVLRRHHARGDRRPRRALGRARRASPRPGSRPTLDVPSGQPAAAKAACGSAHSARCGRTRMSTSRRRCSSSAPARSRSCRRRTPTRSVSATATGSRSGTAGVSGRK